jgi:hypothetical protein
MRGGERIIMIQKRRWKTGIYLFLCKSVLRQTLFITIGILTIAASSFAANDAPLTWPDDNPVAEQLGAGPAIVPWDEAPAATAAGRIFNLAPAQSFGSLWVAQGPGPATNGQVENPQRHCRIALMVAFDRLPTEFVHRSL